MTICESWKTIEHVLLKVAPDVAHTLRPGASKVDIARLEAVLGLALPDSFRISLAHHDGQDDISRTCNLFNCNHLLTIDEMIRDYEMYRNLFSDSRPAEWLAADRIMNVTWCVGWVKFTDCEGDGFVLDLAPGPNGTVGQVFCRAQDEIPTTTQADSFEEFLMRIASLLQDGRFEIVNGNVVFGEFW